MLADSARNASICEECNKSSELETSEPGQGRAGSVMTDLSGVSVGDIPAETSSNGSDGTDGEPSSEQAVEGTTDRNASSQESDDEGRDEPSEENDEGSVPTGGDQDTTESGDDSTTEEAEEPPRYGNADIETGFWDPESDTVETLRGSAETVEGVGDSGDESTGTDPLDARIDSWKEQLLDLTRRNKLVNFKETKTKSLPLTSCSPTEVANVLTGDGELYIRENPEETDGAEGSGEAGPNEAVSTRDRDTTENSLYRIGLNQKQFLRERGVDTLYLALGTLQWYSVEYSDTLLTSPLFLAPVELEDRTVRDGERHNYVVSSPEDDLIINPSLRKLLASEHGIELPGDEQLSLDTIDSAFEAVDRATRGFSRWSIVPDLVLGIFDFAKFSIYTDIEEHRQQIKNHPLIRALNDDPSALQATEGDIDSPTAEELDEVVSPTETYQVLDADSSQQEAIEAAKSGRSIVIQGPPGTGKSQTIANIIAEKIADGETVLFVSEKQAALDVVRSRLDDVGLGRFCLEAHGKKATKTRILDELETELNSSVVKSPSDRSKQLRRLEEIREFLNNYGRVLLTPPEGFETSPYEAHGIVSRLEDTPTVTLPLDEPLTLDQETVEIAERTLEELAQFTDPIDNYATHPWRHTTIETWRLDTVDTVESAIEGQKTALQRLDSAAETIREKFGIEPETVNELRNAGNLLSGLDDRPQILSSDELLDERVVQNAERIIDFAEKSQEANEIKGTLLERYERSFLSADGQALHGDVSGYGVLRYVQPGYYKLKRRITSHALSDYDPDKSDLTRDTKQLMTLQRLEAELDQRHEIRDILGSQFAGDQTDWTSIIQAVRWRQELREFDFNINPIEQRLSEGRLPEADPHLETLASRFEAAEQATNEFGEIMDVDAISIDGRGWWDTPIDQLVGYLDVLSNQVDRLQSWVQFQDLWHDERDTIAGVYLTDYLEAGHDASDLVESFRSAFYRAWLNDLYAKTQLSQFSPERFDNYLDEFRELDQEQQELAKIEIQHEVTKQRPAMDLEHAGSSEQVILRREIEKQRRHKPLRQLFDEAGNLITTLKPCFMMSPLSVAQYLKTDAIEFDAVIFDEASQITPEDAVSSIIRADQSIIAGDSKQLPPTQFFEADVETAEGVRQDLDSILEEASAVIPEKYLRWHYRSRTEELIEFSNRMYYDGRLQTFPDNDADTPTGVEFDYVENGLYDRGGSRQNRPEAERVVDLIEEHAEEHPEKSLGVVAFSSAQETAIRDELEKRRESNPKLDMFVSGDEILDEFFIKRLEIVQGDERDRMIFSVGYGPDHSGKITMNFGPLNNSGGERRLNVAVTRARERVTVVTSLDPGDIDPEGLNNVGVEHFKKYLEYAKNGPDVLARDDTVTETLQFDSSFEEAVYTALEKRGHDVVTQVQSSGYSIDLAIKHPDRPGEFVLGIECDGAAYHSSKTARDRDRTRQTQLERLGWVIHRIWSPDWATNKEAELAAIEERIDNLVEDGTDGEDLVTAIDVTEREVEEVDHEEVAGLTEEFGSYHEPYPDRTVNVDFHDVRRSRLDKALQNAVSQAGPIEEEQAFQFVLDRFGVSRLGKKIRSKLESRTRRLDRRGDIVLHDGFLWPPRMDLDFVVRKHDQGDSRSIEEIPLDEIAKAAYLLLENGVRMDREDLVLETARLFDYRRVGERIRKRVNRAIDLLVTLGLITESDQVEVTDTDADADEVLLGHVYG